MERNVLVTGASGFVGYHLTGLLLQAGYRVVALDAQEFPNLPAGVEFFRANLTDPDSLTDLPKQWWGVVHLAAISVPSQFSSVAPVITNLQMTLNLLEHLASGRVLIVSSCHVYAPSGVPLREGDPVRPQGRYGLSKHLGEQVMAHYLDRLDIRIARPFNHIGPGMRQELMVPSLMRRIAELAPGDCAPLAMRGTNSIRDFIDVRDVAAAYRAILQLDNPGPRAFNVCTGRGVSILDVVKEALKLAGLERSVTFQAQPNSQDDIPYIVGSPERLMASTGWAPEYTLSDSLRSLTSIP